MPPPLSDDGKIRVVVTGLSVISPIGIGAESFWKAAVAGRVGTGEITQFDTSACLTHRGGEVKDFDPASFIRQTSCSQLSRSGQFAVAVTQMAIADASLSVAEEDCTRIGVCFGLVLGNRPTLEAQLRDLHSRKDAIGDDVEVRLPDPAEVSRAPAAEFNLQGPNATLANACAAGNTAISFGMDMIQAGRADVMIAGGADELSPAMFIMFNRFQALAADVVRPFDRNRKGLMLSEGAGALILESLEHAHRRQARIYCEVRGHGHFSDAYHMTAPHPKGLGAVRAMRTALQTARLRPQDVDHINAHGTGTVLNDLIESQAIHEVFGDAARSVPVSSIKAMVGHTQGAASSIEATTCVLTIRDNIIPPTMNLEDPDPQCDLDVVANVARSSQVSSVLNNSFGFGGNVSSVLFARL